LAALSDSRQPTLPFDLTAPLASGDRRVESPAAPPPAGIHEDVPLAGAADHEQPRLEFVRHARARRYLIRVKLDGSVRVTIPRRGSRREAAAFVAEQRDWITAQRLRVARVRQSLPQDLSHEQQRVLRARARVELPARLLELAAPLNLVVTGVSIRSQRQRWGSCSPSGHISLNWRLVTMPDWVRDYVLYHELMHLKRMDHSPAFWAHVAEVCPQYREARAWLRRHALAPHAAHPDLPADDRASPKSEVRLKPDLTVG
jgi:predicted metal-dependent hydrolase